MWLHSSYRAFPVSTWWRITLETPHRMPWLNQLVIDVIARARPEQQVAVAGDDAARAGEPFAPARMSAQIMPIGVRDIVLPPIPTEVAVAHERRRFLERDDLVAQTAVARATTPRAASRRQGRLCPATLDRRQCLPSWGVRPDLRVELLDQAVPRRDAVHQRRARIAGSLRRSKSSTVTPCCSTQV